MSRAKTERNAKIVELRDKQNMSFRHIPRELVKLGLDDQEIAEKNVRKIYHREKGKYASL